MASTLKFKIAGIRKDTYVETGEKFLDVRVEISDEAGEVLEERNFAYPPATTKKELTIELKKFKKNYLAELAHKEENAESEKVDANADKVIEELQNKEI
jgi:hypothetical protein